MKTMKVYVVQVMSPYRLIPRRTRRRGGTVEYEYDPELYKKVSSISSTLRYKLMRVMLRHPRLGYVAIGELPPELREIEAWYREKLKELAGNDVEPMRVYSFEASEEELKRLVEEIREYYGRFLDKYCKSRSASMRSLCNAALRLLSSVSAAVGGRPSSPSFRRMST